MKGRKRWRLEKNVRVVLEPGWVANCKKLHDTQPQYDIAELMKMSDAEKILKNRSINLNENNFY